jgi:hypothetical protein
MHGGGEMVTIGREGQRIDLGRQVFENQQLAAGGHLPEANGAISAGGKQGARWRCFAGRRWNLELFSGTSCRVQERFPLGSWPPSNKTTS